MGSLTRAGEVFAASTSGENWSMSSTSIRNGFVVPAISGERRDTGNYRAGEGTTYRERSLLEMLALKNWRRLLLETFAFLVAIVLLQRWVFGVADIPGLPHPYWLPVLLASCQYGVSGGMIATAAASAVYFFGLSPPSAAQDLYAYAAMVAIQPAVWLGTALIIGGLRNLHIHQAAELADQLAACHRRANDLSEGLERSTAEINALERRIAVDMSSVAALSRGFSLIDMSNRLAAATSFGELFRVGTGTATFTIYLKGRDGYLPVWAVEEDIPRSTKSMEPLPSSAIASTADEAEGGIRRSYIVRVPASDVESDPLAVIVCKLDPSQDAKLFSRRADELSHALATILYTCPDQPAGVRS